MQPSPKPPKHRPLWQFLLPPMLLISLGLHGIVLFTPVAPSEDDLVPPPDPEEDGIAITKIDAPSARATTSQRDDGTVKTAPSNSRNRNNQAGARNNNSRQNNDANRSNQQRSNRANNSSRNQQQARNRDRPNQQSNQPSNRQDSVPDLSDVQSVDNPNPTAPTVAVSVPGLSEVSNPFEEYFEVFKGYRGQTITPEQGTEQKDLWLSGLTQRDAAYANLEIQSLKDIGQVPYEAKVCLPNPPAAAQVLVLVEADGNLDDDRLLVQTTGYRGFDRAARDLVKQHTYPDIAAPQAYLVEVEVDYDESDCQQPQEVINLPPEYFGLLEDYIGPDFTTIADAKAAEEAWLKTLNESGDIEFTEAEEPTAAELAAFAVQVDYDLGICLPIAPLDARWGVLVNPDGTLNGEPAPLRSTGYSSFDVRSKELVENYDFPETETPQAYGLDVSVDYNNVNCQQPAEKAAEFENAAEADDSNQPTVLAGTAFDPARQDTLMKAGRQNVENNSLGSLNNNEPDLIITILEAGWPEAIDKSCFLSESDPEAGLVPTEEAEDVVILSQNADRVPDTIAELYGVDLTAVGDYCGAPLYELKENGLSQLFASIVGFGTGNSNALVVLWFSDPRQD
ncbi:MAG: hypothetical protein F6K42_14835 [Leptolyngbya sp. SIO1D8]|nr:hypothetical protein [Leptolyngbya sp. SIO1D8]